MRFSVFELFLKRSWSVCSVRGSFSNGRPLSLCYRYFHDFTLQSRDGYFNFTKDVVGVWAQKKPDHVALFVSDGTTHSTVTYKELYREAQVFATALCNPSPPKMAMVVIPKSAEWILANLAASWAGTIFIPGTPMLTARDLKYRVQRVGADCLICGVEAADKVDSVGIHVPRKILVASSEECRQRPGWENYYEITDKARNQKLMRCKETRDDDMVQLFFTSGTSGTSKLAPHTQLSYAQGHEITSKYWHDLNEEDLFWNLSDTGWAKAAWANLYSPLIAGCSIFVFTKPRFNPQEGLQALNDYPISVMCAPPTALRGFVQCDLGLLKPKSLRHCTSGGEPLNPEVFVAWKNYSGVTIFEGYGQTETTLLVGTLKHMTPTPGSMGRPGPGYDVKVVDEQLNELGPDEEGTLAVSLKEFWPKGLIKGYYDDKSLDDKAFVGGYYLTGDKVWIDRENRIWFVGRADDVIITSGYRIGPFEVESALMEHPSVADVAVVSSPDSLRGEIVKAFVVLSSKAEHKDLELVKDLQEHVKRVTAPYKYPRKESYYQNGGKEICSKLRALRKPTKERSSQGKT